VVEPTTQFDHRGISRIPLHSRLGGAGALDEQRRPIGMQRAEWPYVFTRHSERLSTGRQNVYRVSLLQDAIDKRDHVVENVLAIVEYK